MKPREISHIALAVVLLTLVAGLQFAIKSQWNQLIYAFAFSTIIIVVAVMSKKFVAYLLDADIEHEIWHTSAYGLKKSQHFKKPVPAGLIIPLLISIVTLGQVKFSALLTYEARALKYRSSKRFGFYSFKEITDWHHALIGGASTIALLILASFAYLFPQINLEYFAKLSVYYAFWNLLPLSKLDGAQIFFGSRILWSVLATITSVAVILSIITV
ncbi:MAG: hypothetical protein Q7S27_04265 [Nanoarchaeota archaeon]|nr:hypothetical protein [Nanoarchaeota archaeon]